jgi:hypothetical protein
MKHKTKTQDPERVKYPKTEHTLVLSSGGAVAQDYTRTDSINFDAGRKSITYEVGPRRIEIDGRKVSAWKWCVADTSARWVHEPCTYTFHQVDNNASWLHDTYQYGSISLLPWRLNVKTSSNWPTYPSAIDRTQVYSDVWAKIAQRTNSSLLSLEDFAGFMSGRSLWSAIRSVGSHTNMLAKTIRDLRRVKRHFGGRESLYQLWQSAKAELCSVLGLHLGYRFSFKTTLHDLDQACTWASEFDSYVRSIATRQGGEYLPYSSSKVAVNENVETISPYLVSQMCYGFGNYSYFNWIVPPPATIRYQAVRKLSVLAYAKVRYTTDRATVRRYLERQLGLDRPLSTLWAIVPLSFVIDYLIPVQDLASYFDNWLSDYDVCTQFSSAWALETRYMQAICDFPSFSQNGETSRYPVRLFESSGARCVYTGERHFERYPIPVTDIRDHFTSFLVNQENKWYRSIGTGLEILSQLHH